MATTAELFAASVGTPDEGRYTGPAYPFGPTVESTFGPKSDLAVIFTSIENILTTPIGSQRYDLQLGSYVPWLLFDINDEITRGLIRYYTFRDLSKQEPRIVVHGVYTQQPDEYTVIIMVSFSLVGDPTATVYSAPVPFDIKGN